MSFKPEIRRRRSGSGAPSKLDERRRSSGGTKEKIFSALRRVSLVRRGSHENDLPLAQATPAPVAKRPSMDSIPASVRSPSMGSSSRRSSLVAPVQRLNSSSPASELPKTWAEWNRAYQMGWIDFDDPPPPPTDLGSSDFETVTGQFRAPFPANENKRQRAVDNINSFLFNQTGPRKRRGSLQDPKDATELPPPVPAPDAAAPPPQYEDEDEDTPMPLATKRQEAPIHPALEKLAQKAKERFGVDATTVSLMDRDQQVFLADSSCTFLEKSDTVPRELTCCSHAQLKFSSTNTTDPLVILDFAKDWRFNKNGFGDYKSGFYAASPIMLPAPLGDDAEAYPAGIFCLLGEKPKEDFTDIDRQDLQGIADEAATAILEYAAEQQQVRKGQLKKQRQEWKKSKLVRRVSGQPNLDTVVEVATPPMTPDLGGLDLNSAEDQEKDALVAQAGEYDNPPRRPSLAESIGSDGSAIAMGTTSVPPVFGSRRNNGRGVLAAPSSNVPAEIQSVLDLSTQLVAESIEMDFAYVVAVDLVAAKAGTTSPSPIRLISVHGLPVPPPAFSIESHLEPLTSERKTLLFTNEQFDGAEGEYSTGLLVKIARVGDTAFALGVFSEDGRRVLNTEDLLFLKSFARDLAKYTADL
ncbi:hypothetical protein JCM6882_008232 [Rhodosporidiobolus microsporus]